MSKFGARDIVGVHPTPPSTVSLPDREQAVIRSVFSQESAHLLRSSTRDDLTAYERLGAAVMAVPSLSKAEVYCNDAFFELTGVDRERANFSDVSLATLVHVDDRSRLQALCESLTNGDDYAFANLRLRSGELGHLYHTVSARLTPPTSAAPGTIALVASEVDDLVSASQQARSQFSQVDLIENGKAFGFYDWEVGGSGRLRWSSSHYRLMGYRPGEFESTIENFKAHVHPDDRAGVEERLQHLVTTGGTLEQEFRLRHRDGSHFWVRAVSKMSLSDHGEAHLSGIVYNVADKHHAVQAASRARLDMEEFVYSITHDLRAPIRHIESFLALFKESGDNNLTPEQRKFLDYTMSSAQKLGHMVDGLLSHNRLKDVSAEATWISLDQVIRRVISLIPTGEREGVRFDISPLPFAYGVRVQLEQLFFVLLHNAVTYSADREEPKVSVDFLPDHERGPAILVKDNGMGFDDRYVKKLFKLFEHLHDGPQLGVGVGLATAKRIVALHRGEIWGSGEVNRGATFGFTIPRLSTSVPDSAELI